MHPEVPRQQIEACSAMLSNRAAMLTPSPISSPSLSATTSPKMNSGAEFDASSSGSTGTIR
jgi:hypothetical protein